MGSSQADVEVSYGVSNEFFQLWLDDQMSYTCGVFQDRENYSDTLEDSQTNKLRFLSEMAHVGPQTESVLDIGCGWGANVEYQATVNRVPNVHGFTLSAEQHRKCAERSASMTNVTTSCANYLDYEAPTKFDSAICIGMTEHIVTPEDGRAGKAPEIYRDFFRRVHSWTKPETHMALQCITRCNVPRRKADLDDLRHSTYKIFPNAVTPRVEEIIIGTNPYYEVIEMHSRRFDYRMTCFLWRDRLQKHQATIRAKWGDEVYEDHDRYLTYCIKAFENNWQSLHQFSLKRLN